MKAALAAKKAQQDEQRNLSDSYVVPALDGRLIQATPLKFCLNYRDPTIAVVYTLPNSKLKKSGKVRKFIHEIHVDFKSCMESKGSSTASKPSLRQIEKLCDILCSKEPTYLNTTIISKTQVSYHLRTQI